MKGKRGKIVAGFEMVLVLVSLFALCYFVDLSENLKMVSAASGDEEEEEDWKDYFLGGDLIENETWKKYPISSMASGEGCCFVSKDGQVCGTSAPENCISDSPFAEGAICSETSFCEKGCCYDESSGIYDKNVLEIECPAEWIDDPNCNMPEANLGCCVLGEQTIFETRGQCEVDSLIRAIGEGMVDWRGNVNEAGCLALIAGQEMGACVLDRGGCKFVSENDCASYNGDFAMGYLCTSPGLNTSCEMTRQTMCVDGKDEVYFVDSCGNPANVYDSSRADDAEYWDKIISEGLCGSDDEGANAESESCGNCDRFVGSICASANEDNFDVNEGGFYCKDTSCMFEGKRYRNGESWCIYDGAIGNGDDVVGSRHWKYVCSQGVVQIEPCADYRNQICIQSNIEAEEGEDFSNAACVANNWRECIALNSEDEDAMRMCEEALNCRVDNVNIADKFNFNVCLPKYPGGFSLTNERYAKTANSLCSMGSQTCTVVRKPKTWGGCKYVANEGCLHAGFVEEMNDFCTGLGDCGGAVNIVGEYSENYAVMRDGSLNRGMFLSQSLIGKLKDLAAPVKGQFAEVEDYSKFLEAAGVLGMQDQVAPSEEEEEMAEQGMLGGLTSGAGGMGAGLAGIGYAASKVAGTKIAGSLMGTKLSASVSAYAGVAIGAGVGMIVGSMIAKWMGLSEGGSMLMAVGGALVGGILGAKMAGLLPALGPVGWTILVVGLVLMVVGGFFGGNKCPPIEVSFECRAWQPPSGGSDCDECNGDPLKPCSQYRCESLGSSCEFINVGTENELCVDGNPNDKTAPIINRQGRISFEGGSYVEKEGGIEVVGEGGGCVAAYTPLTIGVVASEPSQCRFDVTPKENFEDMTFLFSGNSYLYNHTTIFTLPDPSHGQSQGANWTGRLDLYVKCRDRAGLISPGFFKIEMCVAEGEDRTAPMVVKTVPENNRLISFDSVEQDVKIMTNELSECKWDVSDREYDFMRNDLTCNDTFGKQSSPFGYVCSGTLPVSDGSAYYVRCMDQPWLNGSSERNANKQSYVLNLRKPTSKISINKIVPYSDFEIGSDFTTVDLKVATSNGGESHFCSYSFSGYENMIEFFETGSGRTHEQVLNRISGPQKIYIECRDETGDFARNVTSFDIIRDNAVPAISRIWQDGNSVNLVLTEYGECKFSLDSCRFAWESGNDIGSGTELRFAVTRGERYHVKCMDEFGNLPSGCSVEMVAT